MSHPLAVKQAHPIRLACAALALGGVLWLGISPPAHAQAPAEQTQNDVRYLTGGIGSDESEAIKSAMKDYSLALIFARPQEGGAAYLSDVRVVIENDAGKSMLNATADGPYLLVKLPPGTYKVTANASGDMQSKTLQVKAGETTQQRFDWKK